MPRLSRQEKRQLRTAGVGVVKRQRPMLVRVGVPVGIGKVVVVEKIPESIPGVLRLVVLPQLRRLRQLVRVGSRQEAHAQQVQTQE